MSLVSSVAIADCEPIIKAFEVEVELKDRVIERQLQYAAMVEAQRDKAYDLAEKGVKEPIPWYLWALVGAASGVTAMCVAGGCK